MALFVLCLVDIFFADWIREYNEGLAARDSVFHLLRKCIVVVLVQISFATERLLIHENQALALSLVLCLIPLLMYTIKAIPLRYTVFSEETKRKLDMYDYLLQLTKSKYNQMTQNLNKLAMQKPDEHRRFAEEQLQH